MSDWKNFLTPLRAASEHGVTGMPGAVMISFASRYLEPLETIRYRIQYDEKTINGVATEGHHTVEVHPKKMLPIRIFIWSKMRGDFKYIDEYFPKIGRRMLITVRMKTFKHESATLLHPTDKSSRQSTTAGNNFLAAKVPQPSLSQGVLPILSKNTKDEPEHQAQRKTAEIIQVEQLKKIFPAAEESYLKEVADELNADLEKYKLDSPLRRAHFFAQVRQEAGASLSPKQECLNYRPEVLIEKFSYYRDRPDEAMKDGRLEEAKVSEMTINGKIKKIKKKTITQDADQVKIANKAYAGKGKNGHAETGDGWAFRGRGIFQLTLRANYTQFSKEYSDFWSDGPTDFVSSPDKVCEFPNFVRSAVWFWVRRSVYAKADGGSQDSDVDEVTLKVNGAAMDAADKRRKNFHELCYPVFK